METVTKKVMRAVFTVKEKIFITPHYIRVVFHLPDEHAELFQNARAGAHNKIFIPAPGTNQIIFPDETITDATTLSVKRTYTTRRIDHTRKELWIDFVAHGDDGPASYWAQRAEAGSVLGIAMKEKHRPLFPDADEYLFAGDSTAIPVISTMLEELPGSAHATVIIEVNSSEDEITLSSKAKLDIEWVYTSSASHDSRLTELVKARTLPTGKRFVFVAAEYSTVKDLKAYFKEEQNWDAKEYTVVSYWKRGESEDASSRERQEQRAE